MQKRKIEEDKIWEAYKRIITGESLTQVANSKEISLDRGTLRRYIEAVVEPNLNEYEKKKFEEVINKNFRGNSTENKRGNRNGVRKRAAEEIEKNGTMQEMAEYGVTPDQIEALYHRLRENKRTTFSRDTYIYKCLEHLSVFREMGITTEQAFEIFMRRPKLFTGNPEGINQIYTNLVLKYKDADIARQKLIDDPWIDLRDKATKSKKSEAEFSEDGGGR